MVWHKKTVTVNEMTETFFLPDELWYSIFLYLDIKSILQCSTTCKLWRSIIVSQHARTHLWFLLFKHHMIQNEDAFHDILDLQNEQLRSCGHTFNFWKEKLAKFTHVRHKTRLLHTFSVHSDEIWYIEWNHKGDMLATAGKDGLVQFFELIKDEKYGWNMKKKFSYKSENGHAFGFLAWSHDDKKILLTQAGMLQPLLTETIFFDLDTRTASSLPARPFDTFSAWCGENEFFVGVGALYRPNIIGQRIGIANSTRLGIEKTLELEFPRSHNNYAHLFTMSNDKKLAYFVTGDNINFNNRVQYMKNLDIILENNATVRIDSSTLPTIKLDGTAQGLYLFHNRYLYINVRKFVDPNVDLTNEEETLMDENMELQVYDLQSDHFQMPIMIFKSHKIYSEFLTFPHCDRHGEYVSSGSGDGKVIIWSNEFGFKIGEWQEHRAHVTRAAWHPVHNLFVTASDDMLVGLWSTE